MRVTKNDTSKYYHTRRQSMVTWIIETDNRVLLTTTTLRKYL